MDTTEHFHCDKTIEKRFNDFNNIQLTLLGRYSIMKSVSSLYCISHLTNQEIRRNGGQYF